MATGTVWYGKLRGVTLYENGVQVPDSGRVSGLNFLDSSIVYDPDTGLASIELAGTAGDLDITSLRGASNTLVIGHADGLLLVSHTSATTLTVPPNASVAFDVGTSILVVQYGAGPLAIAAGVGVTIRSAAGLRAKAQYSLLRLIKIGTNEWVLDGDLLGGVVSVLASNATVPFDIPNSGTYGSPTGMSVTFGQSYAGDKFIIDAWVQITEGGGNARDVTSRLRFDGATLITTQALEVAANGVIQLACKYIHTLASDNESPEFDAAYLADGAGPDVTAGAISVQRIPA